MASGTAGSNSAREEHLESPVLLLVDADPVARLAFGTQFRGAGYAVLEAADANEAVAAARRAAPAVAIVSLPNPAGVDVCVKLNASGHIPIIFLSKLMDANLVNDALMAGVFVYLVQPIEPLHLLPVIQAALHRISALQSQPHARQADQRLTEEQQRHVNVVTGLLMERLHISHNDAYNRLRQYARSRQTKIVDVARGFLDVAESNHRFVADIVAASDMSGMSGSRPTKAST